MKDITTTYLNELRGKTKYFESGKGKFLKTSIMFAVGAALGAAVTEPIGAVAGFALSQLDTFWIDSMLQGKNPSMFIDDVKLALEDKQLET